MKQARATDLDPFRERIASALPQVGACDIQIDDDGDFVFRHGDLHLMLILDKRDPGYLRVILPNFAEADSPERRARLLSACAQTCGMVKLAKLFFNGDDLCATAETYVPQAEVIDSRFLDRLVSSTIAAAAYVVHVAPVEENAASSASTQRMIH